MDASEPILYVEDDPVDVGNLRRAFSRCGFARPVSTAGNGAEALALLRGDDVQFAIRPGVILIDLNMPVMGGLELLRALKSDAGLRSIPVVVFSASRHDRDVRAAYEHGAASYVVKPIDFDGFVDVVATIERYWAVCEVP
jgi:CheY-like chemotaxis protein